MWIWGSTWCAWLAHIHKYTLAYMWICASHMNTYMNICESCGYGALTFIYMWCGYGAVTYEYIYEYMRVMWIWGSYIYICHVDMGLSHMNICMNICASCGYGALTFTYMWCEYGAVTYEYIYAYMWMWGSTWWGFWSITYMQSHVDMGLSHMNIYMNIRGSCGCGALGDEGFGLLHTCKSCGYGALTCSRALFAKEPI